MAPTSLDPRTPVIVGVGQVSQRPADPADAVEAVRLMEAAVTTAAEDAGAPTLLAKADAIGVIVGAWRYSDPARLVADAVGATNARTILTANGGNTPQAFVNHLAERIQSGDLDVAIACGAETIWSRRKQRAAGLDRALTEQVDVEPDEHFQKEVVMSSDFERARGLEMPVNFYPLFESAFRASRGESIADHRTRVAQLWERFNATAVANEHAWLRTPMTAEEIREGTPGNRMVGFPYTKAMNSNWNLDQGAAVMLCSVEAAEAAGVPRDRWVFIHAGTDGHDTLNVSHRPNLYSSTAMRAAGHTLFELTGTGPDDLSHVDLYSCFPSAVQISATELGLDLDRSLTVTGGLTFAGGPLNNYVTHSIAAMTDVLRNDPGTLGLVTANGGYLTKHAMAIYSTTPAADPFRSVNVQDTIDAVPGTEVDEGFTGEGTIEAYTVMHSADGPEKALAAVRTPDGARTWANSTDGELMTALMTSEHIGEAASLNDEGTFALA